jgi:hypothetical protein
MKNIPDIAYLAGLLDGEGCIALINLAKSGNYRINLHITNLHRATLEWVAETFGGLVSPMNIKKAKRPMFMWTLGPKNGLKQLLVELLPYLKIKEKQTKLAIEFLTLCEVYTNNRAKYRVRSVKAGWHGSKKYRPARQKQIYEQMKALKWK